MTERDPTRKPDEQIDVSFLIAAYNVSRFIEHALRSALGQERVSVEVIVVDDASSDDTALIVERIAKGDQRVRLVRRKINGGPSAARNMAIDIARGRWLAILDGDDVIVPERSARLLDLAAATSADIVADNFLRMDAGGVELGRYMLKGRPGRYAFEVDVASYMRGNALFDKKARLGAIKPMLRTETVRRMALRYREDIHNSEDYFFCLEALLAGLRFIVSGEALYRYRMHSESISWRISLAHLDKIQKVHEEFQLCASSPDIKSAAKAYSHSISAARTLTLTIENAKKRRWSDALHLAAMTPAAWPVLWRTATEASTKRLVRLVKRVPHAVAGRRIESTR